MSKRWADVIANEAQRAQRFGISMSMHFRPLQEISWLEAEVENISRSGILFRAPRPLDVNTRIEMRFNLPLEMGGEAGAHVVCAGEITRVIPPPTSEERPTLAARIFDYRLVRGADGGDE